LLARVPVWVITNSRTALMGAASYGLDVQREWTGRTDQ
jgi:hypothetical protein